jgi:hypothetical protein
MWVDRTLHENRIFLQNEVQLAADPMLETTSPGNPWAAFSCSEVESLACIFAAAGRQDVYDFIIHAHCLEDDAEDLDFHLEMYGDGAPPRPLGREHADA